MKPDKIKNMVTEKIREEIKKVFSKKQADVLLNFLNIVDETVKAKDFNELKAIVSELAKAQKELAEAQKRTEKRVEELAEAQKRTEERVEELAIAQKRTEERVEELAIAQKELAEAQKRTEEEIKKLAISLSLTRGELGGLGRTLGYAFENEAYRMLPKILKEKYGIDVLERFVREEIGGKEINLLGKGRKDGKELIIVGEAKLRLEDRREEEIFKELEEKIDIVKKEFGEVEILTLLVTHYASKAFLKMAKERGIIVIQSFEW